MVFGDSGDSTVFSAGFRCFSAASGPVSQEDTRRRIKAAVLLLEACEVCLIIHLTRQGASVGLCDFVAR